MDYAKAASYWETQDAKTARADRALVAEKARAFIAAHNTCALATGAGESVRCTPIEYTYWRECFWMLSEGGAKFSNLAQNKNVCLAIYDAYTGFGALGGMQVSGTAELAEPWGEEYRALLEYKKIPAQALQKLDHTMYLIKVTPQRIDFLHSDFKKMGFAARQTLCCAQPGAMA